MKALIFMKLETSAFNILIDQQVGTELGQARLELELKLDVTKLRICCKNR